MAEESRKRRRLIRLMSSGNKRGRTSGYSDLFGTWRESSRVATVLLGSLWRQEATAVNEKIKKGVQRFSQVIGVDQASF